jgi:hypothetical protein
VKRASTNKWKSKEKPQLSLQSRLRDLGFKLGRAEMHEWYGKPGKYESMRNAHRAMLNKQYNLD